MIADDYTFDNVRRATQGFASYMLAQGKAVSAEHALPTYVRDKVAQTTAERAAIKAAQAAAA